MIITSWIQRIANFYFIFWSILVFYFSSIIINSNKFLKTFLTFTVIFNFYFSPQLNNYYLASSDNKENKTKRYYIAFSKHFNLQKLWPDHFSWTSSVNMKIQLPLSIYNISSMLFIRIECYIISDITNQTYFTRWN